MKPGTSNPNRSFRGGVKLDGNAGGRGSDNSSSPPWRCFGFLGLCHCCPVRSYRHESRRKQRIGQGTYFFANALTSCSNRNTEKIEMSYYVLAEVQLVGRFSKLTRGSLISCHLSAPLESPDFVIPSGQEKERWVNRIPEARAPQHKQKYNSVKISSDRGNAAALNQRQVTDTSASCSQGSTYSFCSSC